MLRPSFEVADIVRGLRASLGPRLGGGLSRDQRRALSAIEACRTARLGGHRNECEDCGHVAIAYNSCRNRHCPKCQAAAAHHWLEARQRDLLPVAYYHVVFTLPAAIADIAYANKRAVYGALFKAVAETLQIIGADPKHLGAKLGAVLVLHTWGSAMTHHPHIHGVVPCGGLSLDGTKWVDCRKRFFLPVRVLSRLFRRLMCERLERLHAAGALKFYGRHEALAGKGAIAALLKRERRRDWVVYAKRPFAGPQQVLAYLSRYTHRIAISNNRITGFDGTRVTFRVKNYRKDGSDRYGVMTLDAKEFMRRFLLHVLPASFHRIRHIGFLANTNRVDAVARIRKMLADRMPLCNAPGANDGQNDQEKIKETTPDHAICSCCGGRMIMVEIIPKNSVLDPPAIPPPQAPAIDSS